MDPRLRAMAAGAPAIRSDVSVATDAVAVESSDRFQMSAKYEAICNHLVTDYGSCKRCADRRAVAAYHLDAHVLAALPRFH